MALCNKLIKNVCRQSMRHFSKKRGNNHGHKNYKKEVTEKKEVTYLLPYDDNVSILRNIIPMHVMDELPEDCYFDDGSCKLLTFIDPADYVQGQELPSHAIIGYMTTECGIVTANEDAMNWNDYNYIWKPQDYILNSSFKYYYFYCLKQQLKEYYRIHTRNYVDFSKLDPNDKVECIVLDGRVEKQILDGFPEEHFMNIGDALEKYGVSVLHNYLRDVEDGENIVATFNVNSKNKFIDNTYIRGQYHRVLSAKGYGFTMVPDLLMSYMQQNVDKIEPDNLISNI